MRALPALLALLAASLCAAGVGEELWRIGEFDRSYDEFACARNYPAYAQTFPHDVTYRIGNSSPKSDWSFIHPGPADAWAGSRLHPFLIEFDLAAVPRAPLRLTVALVDVQNTVPSALTIKANDMEGTFHLANGPGDATLGDPALGKPQTVSALIPASAFHPGLNRITLLSLGSWVLYDALSLSTASEAGGKVTALSLEPTILFKRRPAGAGVGQVVLARLQTDGPLEAARLTVTFGSLPPWQVPVPVRISFGSVEQELLLPPVDRDTPLAVTAKVGGAEATATVTVKPERRWRIYAAASTHTDIGYTDLQERVSQRHCANTDAALELCRQFPSFAWNLETAWQADEYARNRPKAQRQELYALARAERIGVHANYLNMLTCLCSHEELNRWLSYAHSLKRRYGVPFEVALTTDVPTQTWGVPTTLAAAGIRYFATGINGYRGSTMNKLFSGAPYWWEGPDGSRVLTYFSPGYAQAGGPLHSVADLRNWIAGATRGREAFPYDALYLYGAFGDNDVLHREIAETVEAWNREYEFPKVILAPSAAYFKYMEQTYGDRLPVVRGDAGAYWEDGAASSALETALNRRAHATASFAEGLLALTHAVGHGSAARGAMDQLWRNILLYDEHTWGAWCSTSQPDSQFTRDQWEVKARFAHKASRQSRELLDKGLGQLAGLVSTEGPAVLLVNGTGWDRAGDVVEVTLPAGEVPADPSTGAPLPAVRQGGDPDRALVRAPRVPAWGYAACKLVPGEAKVPQEVEAGAPPVLENERLRLTFDPQTGGICSALDKSTQRELVDLGAPQKLNQYLYVSGGENSDIVTPRSRPPQLTLHSPSGAQLRKEVLPGLGQRMIVTAQCEKTPRLELTVCLWDGSPRVDICDRLTRTETRALEAAYFAFPFAARDPEVRMEIPNGVMRPEVDQLPGACREWFCLQNWLRLRDGGGGVVWSSPDAPLVCLGDINRGLWREKIAVTNGRVYSYLMNNYWDTNYKASQGGEFEFRYSFQPQDAGGDAEAARVGWQSTTGLQATVLPAAQEGLWAGPQVSLCRVRPASVVVTAIKPAAFQNGVVVRLLSLADREITAEVEMRTPTRAAVLCNLMEEPVRPLPVAGSTVRVSLAPLRPTTVLMK